MFFRYDLFISYARKDDQPAAPGEPGWITAFVAELQRTHRQFTPEDLAIFFDRDEIRVAEDWELRIKAGLRDSNLLLACLSPAYFASEWCRREWELYAEHERDRALAGEGVNPIYFIEAPGFEAPGVAGAWISDLRRRNHIDFRPWFPAGLAALQSADVRRRLEELDGQLYAAGERSRAALEAPGTVDQHNRHFVGRREELRQLREMLACATVGVITAVQGLGGVGKTALANEYAHAFAGEYGGGRWLVRCEGQDNLFTALLQLATPLRVEFNDLEKKDTELAARRILAELEARTAAARTEQRPRSDCLLILDNVDQPALLAPAQTAKLPKAPWLHILATTRLGQDQLFERQVDRRFLALDELPEQDALRLIERLQPGGTFTSDAEREAARAIVRRLGSFTLAVEGVAVYLGVHPGVSCAGFLKRLEAEGLGAEEAVVREGEVASQMRHREKQLSLALGPLLDTLSAEERFVLECAALLPADFIPLPWLRALAEERFPALATPPPGYPEPWPQIARRLLGRRLLAPTADRDETGAPRTVRMHRLVQEVLRRRAGFAGEELLGRIEGRAKSRCVFLIENWLKWEHRWEIAPLGALAGLLLDSGRTAGSWIANVVGVVHWQLGNYGAAEPLFRRALEALERVLGPEHPHTLTSVNNLAQLLNAQGNYGAAEPLYRRALEARERVLGPEHPDTLTSVNNLAELLRTQGDYGAAEPLYRRVLEARERVLGPEHPDTLNSVNNLAVLLNAQGNYGAAEPLYRRALEARERVLGPEHPDTLRSVNNLAELLRTQGNYGAAEPLYRRALEAQERVLGPEHPDTLTSVNNLALLLKAQGNYGAAEPLYRRALEAHERLLGPEHPATLTSVNNLALLLNAQGNYGAAEPLYRRALEARERVLGPEHPDTLTSVNNLALLLKAQGNYGAAEPLFRRALETRERVLGPEHPDTLTSLTALATPLEQSGQQPAAADLRKQHVERMLPHVDAAPSLALRQLALSCYLQKDYENAERLLRTVLERGFEVPLIYAHLARLLLLTGREDEAAEAVRAAWEHRAEGPPYFIPRGLFLQALLAMLGGRSPREALGRLKTALAATDNREVWSIGPVLDHLSPRLTREADALLRALRPVLERPSGLEALDEFPEWRDAGPLPVE